MLRLHHPSIESGAKASNRIVLRSWRTKSPLPFNLSLAANLTSVSALLPANSGSSLSERSESCNVVFQLPKRFRLAGVFSPYLVSFCFLKPHASHSMIVFSEAS